MKFLIISDIHGSASSLQTVIDSFGPQTDQIIICGDFLNHGPRNPLPEGWDTKKTAELLNSCKTKIISVRGNCDSEVDQMVLEFPCLSPYSTIFTDNNRRFFIQHGHLLDSEQLISLLPKGTIVISGHTHVTLAKEQNGLYFFNPGSISLPKCEDGKTCAIAETLPENKVKFTLCKLTGEKIREYIF